MIFPWQLSLDLAKYLIKNRLWGRRRFPLILMLEPTLRCNLSCSGCGRIREYKELLDRELTVEECLQAVEEAGTPVVSITGGEPLLHPDIDQIVQGILARKRFLYLCTNGLLLKESLGKFQPNPRLSFVFHIDGLAETHDRIVERKGVFEKAIASIKAAKKAGFQVRVNTTIYKGSDPKELEELFILLTRIGVDGIMLSPAFSFEAVNKNVFLSRKEIIELFQPIYRMRHRFPFYNTPLYLEFLAGKRSFSCTPWSSPTRNPKGWRRPCYLIADEHCQSFRELIEDTPWEKYGVGRDPRCSNCMMHCGFEASALLEAKRNPLDLWRLLKWNLSSPKG